MTSGAIHHGHHLSESDRHAQLEKNARKWVAQTFYGTLLKEMRNDPFKSEVFDGGRGGEAFGALYDQQLADHMSRAAGKGLVNSIVRKIEGVNAYQKASKTNPSHANATLDIQHSTLGDRGEKSNAAALVQSSRMGNIVSAGNQLRWSKP